MSTGPRCPFCGKGADQAMEAADYVHRARPAGAANVCLYCGRWSVYEAGADGVFGLRPMTADEFRAMIADADGRAQIARAQRFLNEWWRRYPETRA